MFIEIALGEIPKKPPPKKEKTKQNCIIFICPKKRKEVENFSSKFLYNEHESSPYIEWKMLRYCVSGVIFILNFSIEMFIVHTFISEYKRNQK